MAKHYFRTIWISDVHLGSKGCQAENLLKFLKYTKSDYLILVGDIIDLWALKRQLFWPKSHNTIIQKLLKKSKSGDTTVIYIPGNHDDPIREYSDHVFGNITIMKNYIHILGDNRKILCLHGDEFDIITKYHRWLSKFGDIGYNFLLWVNRINNKVRSLIGLPVWSLSSYIKSKIKLAVSFISDYEESVINAAKKYNVDVVLCGHIHHAEIKTYSDILYCNTGDWVESCTAIVEYHDGSLEIIKFNELDDDFFVEGTE